MQKREKGGARPTVKDEMRDDEGTRGGRKRVGKKGEVYMKKEGAGKESKQDETK